MKFLFSVTPIHQCYRCISLSEYGVIKEDINQLLAQFISESCTPFASPIVWVKKKDGSLGLCVDYLQLNSRTRKDAFPLPRIKELLDTPFCCCFVVEFLYSMLHFEWNYMPFGLCNVPRTFQRLMRWVFRAQRYKSSLLYLYNILVLSSTFQHYLERLDVVWQQLQEGCKAKLSKCSIFQQEVCYLGRVLPKVELVANGSPATTVLELWCFLRFTSYYRC